jgi:hypothetical protein
LGEAETRIAKAAIRLAPMTFQRHVAAVVRRNLNVKHVADDLPHDVTQKLHALMRRVGLWCLRRDHPPRPLQTASARSAPAIGHVALSTLTDIFHRPSRPRAHQATGASG